MNKKIISIIIWILLFQVIGYVMGLLTQQDIVTWYQHLHKSSLNPPDLVFPIVWGILYVMLAIAGWSIWQRPAESAAKPAMLFFSLQMLMNWTWTPLFFKFHLIEFSFYWLIGIIIFTLMTIFYTRNKLLLATCMLVPYVIWLLFAAYLNWVIFYFTIH